MLMRCRGCLSAGVFYVGSAAEAEAVIAAQRPASLLSMLGGGASAPAPTDGGGGGGDGGGGDGGDEDDSDSGGADGGADLDAVSHFVLQRHVDRPLLLDGRKARPARPRRTPSVRSWWPSVLCVLCLCSVWALFVLCLCSGFALAVRNDCCAAVASVP